MLIDFKGDRSAQKPERRVLTVSGAMDVACESRSGILSEEVQEQGENVAALLSRLVVKLHDKGLLSDDDVIDVLGLGFGIRAPKTS